MRTGSNAATTQAPGDCGNVVFILASCSQKEPSEAILGKWQATHDNISMEFTSDGSVTVGEGDDAMVGTYEFTDTNTMVLVSSSPGALPDPIITTIAVSEDELIITMPSGRVEKHTRVK